MKLSDYLKEYDGVPVIQASFSFGRNISRSEIEQTLSDNGISLPTTDRLCYMIDADEKVFFVRYFSSIGKYGTEKLRVL